MKHLGDIAKISGYTAPIVDCVIGGSPCQDLSVAGKRAGLEGQRSGLFMEQIRIIKEMRENDRLNGRTDELVRPRYMLWENVPGAFSSNKGEDFRIVLEETAKVADENAVIPRPANGKWKTAGLIVGDGWSIAWRVLDAQFWGVPQRRRRIALVADFGGESAGEILFVRKSLSGHSEPSRTKRERTSKDVRGCSPTDSCSWDGSQIAPTLTANNAGGTQRMPDKDNFNCVLQQILAYASTEKDDVAGTLDSSYYKGCGERSGVERTVVAYGVDAYNQTVTGDKAKTLNATASDSNHVPCVMSKYIVRRLTPMECERLQGYPDGWTDIGEWTDSKGKKRKTSDAVRYKALGNSIALPPWKWVLKRLCACYERDATMASLFDGIGGFPYIWEQLNGKGTVLWASEIEEFPIAVTKLRIGD